MDHWEEKPYCFVSGVVICVSVWLLWLLLQFLCHCLCNALVSGVVPSILVLLFMQHANNFGHCFNFGLGVAFFHHSFVFPPLFNVCIVVYGTILLFLSLFQFWCCPLCHALAVLFIVLILVLVCL